MLSSPIFRPDRIYSLAPIFSGVLLFLLLYGIRPLDPQYLGWWGTNSDALQSWLGWSFYRDSPWAFPIGLNQNYGLELDNTIIYTDSIPLLALFFKCLSPFLPKIFQYLGWWTLACFMLQAFFAWKLTTLCTRNFWLQWLGSLLFLISPILFFRLNGHFTLVGQFVLLAALYLCLAPPLPARRWQWVLLICLCSFLHAYLLCMVLFIWLAWLGMELIRFHVSLRKIIKTCIATFICLLNCCWLLGYFVTTPGSAGGFGLFKMNLLSLFDSGGVSHIFPDLPSLEGEYEGYNYLGAGRILLMGICLFPAIRQRRQILACLKRWLPLAAICGLLFLIAISNVVSLGPYTVHFPTNPYLDKFLQPLFRASGRFFLPVNYLLTFCMLAIIVNYFRPRSAIALLSAAVLLQAIDIEPLFTAQRVKNYDLLAQHALKDKLWLQHGFREIRLLPFDNNRPGWEKTGIYATLNGLATNHIYVSRIGNKQLQMLREKEKKLIENGELEPDVIYITDDATFEKLSQAHPDLVARHIDGLPVVITKRSAKKP